MKQFFNNKETGKLDIFKLLFFITYGILLVAMPLMSLNVSVNGDERFHIPQSQHIIDFYTSFGKDNTVNTSAYDVKESEEYLAFEQKKLQEIFGVASASNLNKQQQADWQKLHYRAYDKVFLLKEFGKDTFIPGTTIEDYGSFYEFWAGLYYSMFCDGDPWQMHYLQFRRALVSIFGLIMLLFTALIAKAIGGWRAAFFALIGLACFPRLFGHMFFNNKDIPFAAGYAMAVYFIIRFMQGLPKPSWGVVIGAITGMAITFNIRAAGGILLIAYFIMFLGVAFLWYNYQQKKLDTNIKNYLPTALRAIMTVVGAYFAGVLFWPYGLLDPISHPMEVYGRQAEFPVNISVLFEGQRYGSTQIPSNYLTKWLSITTPLHILLGLPLIAALAFVMRKKIDAKWLAIPAFTLVFPIFWVIYQESTLYDGWRHMLFVAAPMVALAALGYHFLLDLAKNKIVTYLLGAFLVVSVGMGAKYIIENHPHEYVYFNDISGGIEAAYGQFETDYYMLSAREAVEWLIKEKGLDQTDEEIFIGSDMGYPVKAIINARCGENIKPRYASFNGRAAKTWDYGIFYSRYLQPNQFRAWPPRGSTVYTVEVDGVPIACVVDRKKELAQQSR